MNERQALNMLGALSQQTRLRIVRRLVQCGESGACAGDIGKQVGASSSGVSFHLSMLENAGIVTSQRRSRHMIYRANFDDLGALMSFLLNDCCDNHPDIRACCDAPVECCRH